MGTRGFHGFVHNGVEKIAYNHFDSYPEGLGADVLNWARSVTDWDQVRLDVDALIMVNESDEPEREQAAQLAEHHQNVSTGQDWYSTLRALQGDTGGYLEVGYMIDGHTFPIDSLFAEWGYIIDLDAKTFEVYEGFQKELPTAGRWAGRPTAEEDAKAHEEHLRWCEDNGREPWLPEVSEYKACELICSWSLDALPTAEEFDQQVNAARRQYEDEEV